MSFSRALHLSPQESQCCPWGRFSGTLHLSWHIGNVSALIGPGHLDMAQRPGLRCGRNVSFPTVLQRIAVLRNFSLFSFFFFRDQFAHCPWVHVSQDGEQCENGNLVFCLPYGLLAAVLLWLP